MDIEPQRDLDPEDTQAWTESFAEVIRDSGADRGRLLLQWLTSDAPLEGIS